ncbi:hypothetical protein NC651_002878 [Populus alba x Populus x berolinensis]|nr:hypothetical protein NC651_002878 [Populus alba x Populus x berolinensis]
MIFSHNENIYISLFRSSSIERTLIRNPIETKKYRPTCHPHQNKC